MCGYDQCAAGFLDCDADATNGCEAAESITACGAACADCTATVENVDNVQCAAGVCGYDQCAAGFLSCDADTTNGCEQAINNDYCGDCNIACGAGYSCVETAGVWECSADCPDADSDGYADDSCGGNDCDDADAAVNPEAAEVCDDVDNDCNGDTDEGFPDKGTACDGDDEDTCPNGTWVCNAAGDDLECTNDAPSFEACDGLDNDCDGDVDEDWPDLEEPCDGEDADECENGLLVCNLAGNGVVCEEQGQVMEELCNNVDDDCDGVTDEDFGEVTCGIGLCERTIEVCIDGEFQSCPTIDPPENEESTCDDGLDNDCDGFVDENDLDCMGGGGGDGCGCSASGDNRSGVILMLLVGLVAALRRRSRV